MISSIQFFLIVRNLPKHDFKIYLKKHIFRFLSTYMLDYLVFFN